MFQSAAAMRKVSVVWITLLQKLLEHGLPQQRRQHSAGIPCKQTVLQLQNIHLGTA